MRTIVITIAILALLIPLCPVAAAGEALIHHRITARIDPASHLLEATDLVTVPAGLAAGELHFLLSADLAAVSATPGVRIVLAGEGIPAGDVGMDREEYVDPASITRNRYTVVFDEPPAGEALFQVDLGPDGQIIWPYRLVTPNVLQALL